MYPWIKRTAMSLCLIVALAAPTAAAGKMPGLPVTVNGQSVVFDQAPVVVDDVLMVPVRAIAEAAGAVVTWDEGIRLVHIRMPGRTTMIHLDQIKAEMNQDGVMYFARNLISMTKMPIILGDRTLVSADDLSAIFGFQVQTGTDGTLALTSAPAKPGTPAGMNDQAEQGTIAELKTGDPPSILLSGAAMANGEPRRTWVAIPDKTQITIQEGDQKRPGSVSDLQVGAQVAVTYAGPLLMSYPARGTAAEILVQE